ncbi:MAG: hypothetical protein ACR2Q4_24645 [Geminicoccaceae bacterium]
MQATKSGPRHRAANLVARDRAVMQGIEKEQKERDKKTARLRALRLAKEAADKETEEKEAEVRLTMAQKALKEPSSAKKPSRRRTKPPAEDQISSAKSPQSSTSDG